MAMRLEYLDPTTAYAITDRADGTEYRLPVRGRDLVRARAQVAAEAEVQAARDELAQMVQRAQQPPAPPPPPSRRAPVEKMGLFSHSDIVSQHNAGMQRVVTRTAHPELAD